MSDKTAEVIERGLVLNSETMTFDDDCGNEYRDNNGEAIYSSEVNLAELGV